MAKWVLFENRRGTWSFNHQSLGKTHECGELRPDTPPKMVVEWIIEQGRAQPGDIIRFADGSAIQVLLDIARA